MAIASNFPAIRPSLNLDFANARTLDPRITFSRASAATYYDGKTVAKAEQNLLLRSQEFDQAPWEKLLTGSALAPLVTANAGAAPDGTATAARVVFSLNGGVSSGDISQLVQTLTLSGQYVFSVWLKSTDGSSTYNMQLAGAGAVADVTVTGTWQRFMVTGTYAGAYSNQLRLRGAQGVVNSNTADVLVWGSQLEQRSQVTAYTPTTTQPITNYIPVLQTAPAGVPRFDHNPVTGESLGLLAEEQRTNLLTYSEQLDNSSWSKVDAAVAANSFVAPDGSLTADVVAVMASGGYIAKTAVVGATSGQTYSISIFTNTLDRKLTFGGATPNYLNASYSSTPIGNGWYRHTGTVTLNADGPVQLVLNKGAGGAGASFAAWGAQAELGAFLTSYIKTEASQVTRAADSASMMGANFSSWYRQDEGTLFLESINEGGVAGGNFGMSDGTNSNRLWVQNDTRTSVTQAYVMKESILQSSLALPGVVVNTSSKVAMAYKDNDLAATRSGFASVTDNIASIPIVNKALFNAIGQETAATSSGWIRRATYYPKRLTDAQLQALTA